MCIVCIEWEECGIGDSMGRVYLGNVTDCMGKLHQIHAHTGRSSPVVTAGKQNHLLFLLRL